MGAFKVKKNGVVYENNKMPGAYPGERVTYDNTDSGLTAENMQSAVDEVKTLADSKVSKSGDTMSGDLTVDRANGTSSSVGYGLINVGNNIASGTAKNAQGLIDVYGTSAYRSRIKAEALTAHREVTLPDKSGTLAIKEKENFSFSSKTNFTPLATGRNYFYKRNADFHLHCNIYKTSGGGFAQGTWYDVIELSASARPAELIYGHCVFTIEGGAESSKKGVPGIMIIKSSGIVSVMPLDDKYSSINNVSIDIIYPEAF